MQYRIREDHIECADEAKIVDVHQDEFKVPALLRHGGVDHTLGCVDRHHASSQDPFCQQDVEGSVTAAHDGAMITAQVHRRNPTATPVPLLSGCLCQR